MFYDNDIIVDSNQLNTNDIKKVKRIKKFMNVSEVIKSE